ncbi:MAG: MFS transporter, partial [Chloroflexi bacterium]|nr:MFS transporter [Chloroflexota bacterium]
MRLSNTTEKRPRFFYGWYIVGASVALNFYLSIAFFQGLQVFFLPILTDFGWSRTAASGAYSLRQLESGLLAPVVGFLVDRWGPRTIILMGVVVAGAGMVMLGAIQSLWMFYAALMIASIGTSAASHGVTWPVVISSWFHRLRGRALGMAMLGPVVAGPVVVLVAVMEQTLGWRWSLFVLGVGLWIVGIPLALVARSNPERYGYHPDGEQAESTELDLEASSTSADQSSTDTNSVSSLEALRTRQFWLLSLLLGSQFLGTSGLMVHFIALLQSKS